MTNSFFQRLIVPGLVFQSALVGGGYATGRELIEFFLKLGPLCSLAAMLVATSLLSLVCAVAFEYSRKFSLYDYRSFFRKLLGSGWIVFEFAYLAMMILVLSVLGAAAGELSNTVIHIPKFAGAVILMIAIAILVFFGSKTIERALSGWSFLLYLSYGVLITWSFVAFGETISETLTTADQPQIGWSVFHSGFIYAGYNMLVFTTVLFVAPHFASRSDALWAGLLCGPLGMLPGLFLLLGMMAHYPHVIDESLPVSYLLEQLQAPGFVLLFQVVIFGTFIETGTALLHSFNERISAAYVERSIRMPSWLRPFVAMTVLFVAIYLAEAVGIVKLISQGYTYSTYLFLVLVTVPLLTRGLWMILSSRVEPERDNENAPSTPSVSGLAKKGLE